MHPRIGTALALICVLFLFGCGGGNNITSSTTDGTPAPPVTTPTVAITIAPTGIQLLLGTNQQFTTTVTGTTNLAVTWQVNGITGGNSTFGTISGTGMYSAPTTLPSQSTVTVTVISSADPTKSASATIGLQAPPPVIKRFVYVSSPVDDNIRVFSVDDAAGSLTPSSVVTVGAGSHPGAIVFHPSRKFLYSLNRGTGDITIFSVDPNTGGLAHTGLASAAAGPYRMVFSASGQFAYVTCDTASQIAVYAVNTTTGALTQITGSPFAAGGGRVRGLAISPSYLFVANLDANKIMSFSIDASSGSISNTNVTVAAGPSVDSLILFPTWDNYFIFSGNQGAGTIDTFAGEYAFAQLVKKGTTSTSTNSTIVATSDPWNNGYLYAVSPTENKLMSFQVQGDGSLTPDAPWPTDNGPVAAALHPNFQFIYVLNEGSATVTMPGSISIFQVYPYIGYVTKSLGSISTSSNNPTGFAMTP